MLLLRKDVGGEDCLKRAISMVQVVVARRRAEGPPTPLEEALDSAHCARHMVGATIGQSLLHMQGLVSPCGPARPSFQMPPVRHTRGAPSRRGAETDRRTRGTDRAAFQGAIRTCGTEHGETHGACAESCSGAMRPPTDRQRGEAVRRSAGTPMEHATL
jgi:hypothetical protein